MPKHKTTSSKRRKERLGAYALEGRSLKNRQRNIKKHIKAHPEDAQAISALKKGLVSYRRKKPHNNKMWSSVTKDYAHQLRLAGLNGNLAIAKEKQRDAR